ncbi:MAG: fibronectin type III domain-containing protein [Planctomycetes bacterium]|nr:fibronectin type III domain-containing protein [Planctomycetota bacterium]
MKLKGDCFFRVFLLSVLVIQISVAVNEWSDVVKVISTVNTGSVLTVGDAAGGAIVFANESDTKVVARRISSDSTLVPSSGHVTVFDNTSGTYSTITAASLAIDIQSGDLAFAAVGVKTNGGSDILINRFDGQLTGNIFTTTISKTGMIYKKPNIPFLGELDGTDPLEKTNGPSFGEDGEEGSVSVVVSYVGISATSTVIEVVSIDNSGAVSSPLELTKITGDRIGAIVSNDFLDLSGTTPRYYSALTWERIGTNIDIYCSAIRINSDGSGLSLAHNNFSNGIMVFGGPGDQVLTSKSILTCNGSEFVVAGLEQNGSARDGDVHWKIIDVVRGAINNESFVDVSDKIVQFSVTTDLSVSSIYVSGITETQNVVVFKQDRSGAHIWTDNSGSGITISGPVQMPSVSSVIVDFSFKTVYVAWKDANDDLYVQQLDNLNNNNPNVCGAKAHSGVKSYTIVTTPVSPAAYGSGSPLSREDLIIASESSSGSAEALIFTNQCVPKLKPAPPQLKSSLDLSTNTIKHTLTIDSKIATYYKLFRRPAGAQNYSFLTGGLTNGQSTLDVTDTNIPASGQCDRYEAFVMTDPPGSSESEMSNNYRDVQVCSLNEPVDLRAHDWKNSSVLLTFNPNISPISLLPPTEVEIYKNGSSTPLATIKAGSGEELYQYDDTAGRNDAVTYQIRMVYKHYTGSTTKSKIISVTVDDTVRNESLTAPIGFSLSKNNSDVTLNWTDTNDTKFVNSFDEDGVEVWRNDNTANPIAVLSNNETTYVDKSLTANKTYVYKLRTYKSLLAGSFYSGFTKELQIYVDGGPGASIPAPANLIAFFDVSVGAVVLDWDDSTGATSYEIEKRDDTSQNPVFSFLQSVTASYCGDNQIVPGGAYTYRVRAANSNGKSGYSNLVSVTIPSGSPSPIPPSPSPIPPPPPRYFPDPPSPPNPPTPFPPPSPKRKANPMCFVATAVSGDTGSQTVVNLKTVRNNYLNSNVAAKTAVRSYESISPSLSGVIVKSGLTNFFIGAKLFLFFMPIFTAFIFAFIFSMRTNK